MLRKIIKIDEEKCNGCGLCVPACHEGAIEIIDGKARLVREHFCDGLGDCLPSCPADAISFEEREAPAYQKLPCGYTGTSGLNENECRESRLSQWPVQIKLVPARAGFFDGAELLVAADCTAYAYGDFHERFMKGRITLVGCPKLDGEDYAEKLTEIIKNNDIKDMTVVRMEVPCCGGLERAGAAAVKNSGKSIPWRVVTISVDGEILKEQLTD